MAMASASGSALCFTDASSSRAIRRDFGALCFAPKKTTFGFVYKSLTNLDRLRLSSLKLRASNATAVENGKQDGSASDSDKVPTPVVIIDQDSDPDATVVEVTFGDRLGALLDTMNALKNLGLNVVKANVYLDSSGKHNKFAITKADSGRKVEDPELLEAIRLTVINNLLEFHPVNHLHLKYSLFLKFIFLHNFSAHTLLLDYLDQESSSQLAMGAAFGVLPPTELVDVDIATHISIEDDGPDRSLLYVETADRPGLLVELMKIISDISVAVESGEFDTEGLLAKVKFHVSYRNKALIKPLQQVLANSMKYFLRRPSTDESSF
ncbi:ACT domain-containing protein ACR11 isoform X1 [Eutrema salsugineum]|uniref:ACT domain-containing protein ACR11 isoform X1 n=1 Tax=Eutrema salsugineum TaxID=72664 RepID=UPI000CECF490|nr:ACT domain-containing protein ACR11 isoform X1 [Eutrema salsugineum]